METVRAFIAVDIGDGIRARLDALQRKLKKVHADVRWVRPHRIHLTLAFLGDLPLEKLEPLKCALDTSVCGLAPFDLTAVGTGFFGRPGRPRVIWAGLAECPALRILQQRTVQALHTAVIPFDNKPFSPHLTLGRVKGSEHIKSLLCRLEHFKEEPLGHNGIERIDLFQSVLTPHGAEYSVLHRIPLSSG